MRAFALVLVGFFVVCASRAHAQHWMGAYERGDYATAATLLHREVLEGPNGDPFPDETAALQLGLLYAQGFGVEADFVMACAFLEFGHTAALLRHDEGHPMTTRASQLVHEYCDRLTRDERREAVQLAACPVFGIKDQVFHLGAGHWVDVSRRRILDGNLGLTFESGFECYRQFALVRYVRVEPPPDAALAVRHFLEFVDWRSGVRLPEGPQVRELVWHVEEVKDATTGRRSSLHTVAGELLVRERGSAWPSPGLPAEIERGATFRMLHTGDVEWTIASERPLRGLIPRAVK